MTTIFALFFLLLGFVVGVIVACTITLDILRDCASKGIAFIGRYRITRICKDRQEE